MARRSDLPPTCQAGVAGQVRGADQTNRPGPAGIGTALEEAATCEVIDTMTDEDQEDRDARNVRILREARDDNLKMKREKSNKKLDEIERSSPADLAKTLLPMAASYSTSS
jgi:hypothetical protein